jgi:hypothetical protein
MSTSLRTPGTREGFGEASVCVSLEGVTRLIQQLILDDRGGRAGKARHLPQR